MVTNDMKNNLTMQELTYHGNKAYALHKKVDKNEGSYMEVLIWRFLYCSL